MQHQTYRLIKKSSNAKTGPMAVTINDRTTCPATCPFKANGCYAEQFPLRLHWDRVSNGAGVAWAELLQQIAALPAGQPFRYGVAGDLPSSDRSRPNGVGFDGIALHDLAIAARSLKGWAYTHHPTTGTAAQWLRSAKELGFTVNASCHSVADADQRIADGVPAVAVVPHDEPRTHWRSPAGNRVQVCPAQLSDKVTCATCQLCHSRPDNAIIAFRAHGNGKSKAEATLA